MDVHDELRTLIDAVRARWRRRVALAATARLSAAAAMPMAAGAIVYYLDRPQGGALILLAAIALALSALAAAAVAWRIPRRPSDRQVARFVEERAAALSTSFDDALVSAVEASGRVEVEQGGGFATLVLASAAARLRALPPENILPRDEMRRTAWLALGAALVLILSFVAAAPLLRRAEATARLRLFPQSVRIEVVPGNVRVRAGTPVRIRASVRGAAGAITEVVPELMIVANDAPGSVPMAAAGDGFEFTVPAVDRTFAYAVRAGSARSSNYMVTALTPPRVERIDVHYDYPPFSGLPARDQQDGGDLYAPAGTRVRLRIHTDRPIARGELALTHSTAMPLRSSGARTLDTELTLAKDDSYRVRLADHDGMDSPGETEYFIRVMDDRPPDVRILRPSADQQITPLEEVPIEARADDDYGIERFELVYSVAGGSERVVPFERLSGTAVQRIGARLLAAEDLRVKPGDVIAYYARARDVPRGKRSTEATSDIFFLEVKPFNSEFTAAESQAGAGSDAQIESLIQAQKAIISSTWNVERRAQAGRSSADVKAIAAAQAELKTKVEAQFLSRPGGPRMRGPAPQRQAMPVLQPGRSGGDPIAKAADAMGKALNQLETERTRDALAHEMAALNGLLQAQAEERRRQVSQASGAGSGFSNRAEQDLSALFDKELQRQQRTNYETRPSVETRPDRDSPGSDALDRIRDLARRQEDLSRRQSELAKANLSAEEMKRQLEVLTREQTKLREEAEELLRRRGDSSAAGRGRQNQPSDSGRGGTTPGESEALQSASERMRAAAGDLRREDPDAAAANSRRAAEQLRRLAQRGRGSASSGERAESESESAEARQLSDQLEQARKIRERLQQAEEQLRAAETRAGRGQPGGAAANESVMQPAGPGREGAGERASGEPARGGASGRKAGESGRAGGGAPGDVQQLREQYQRELQRAQQALERLNPGQPQNGANGATPEQQEFSRSAPGTEAFKQDRSDWESLRKHVDSALEQYEASVSSRLAHARTADRLSAGGSDRVPDAYRRLIAKYFESLAKKKS